MGIVFRQSVKTTIVIGAGAILGGIINFIYASVLTKPQLGITTNVTNEGAILQFVALLGVGTLIQTFTQRYASTDKRRQVLITLCVLTPIFSVALFTIPYLLLRSHIVAIYNPGDRPYVDMFYIWVPVSGLFWSFLSLFDVYLVSQIKVAVSSFMREVLLRLCNLVLIALFFFNIVSFKVFVIGTMLVYIVPAIVLFFIAAKTSGFGFSFNWRAFSRKEYIEIIHFSWYHLLSGMSLFIMAYVDSLMLPWLDKKNGMAALAVYRIAIFLASILTIPQKAMTSSAFAIVNDAYLGGDRKKLNDMFHRSAINMLIVALAIFIIIACNLHNAVAILPPGYGGISVIVLILMAGRLIDISTGMNNEVISISSLYRFNFRVTVLLVVLIIAFDYFLIPRYSMYGAAIGATLALGIYNIIKMVFLWRRLDIQPFTGKTWLVLLAGAITCVIGYLLPFIINPYADAIIRTCVITIVYGILLIILKPSKDLLTYLNSVKANKKIF